VLETTAFEPSFFSTIGSTTEINVLQWSLRSSTDWVVSSQMIVIYDISFRQKFTLNAILFSQHVIFGYHQESQSCEAFCLLKSLDGRYGEKLIADVMGDMLTEPGTKLMDLKPVCPSPSMVLSTQFASIHIGTLRKSMAE